MFIDKNYKPQRLASIMPFAPVGNLIDTEVRQRRVNGVGRRSGRIIDGGSGRAHRGCRLVGTDYVHRQIRDRNCIAVSISSPSTFRNWESALERCPVKRAGEVKACYPAKARCPSE